MATDWLSAISPHWKPALIGASCGFVTGLLLRRVVKSFVVLAVASVAVYLIIATTTDWLKGVDVAATSRHALAYAKAHRAEVVEAVRRFATTQLVGATGFAVGLAGAVALMIRRRRQSVPPLDV